MTDMRKALDDIAGTAARIAALGADDIIVAGSKLLSARTDSHAEPREPGFRQRKRLKIPVATPGTGVTKQETAHMTTTETATETATVMEKALATFLEKDTTALGRSKILIKIGSYQQELQKLAPMVEGLDDETHDQVIEDWFNEGDRELKTLMWNALAGGEEIKLPAVEAPANGEAELVKMIEQLPENDRPRLLTKIAGLQTDLNNGLLAIAGQTEADQKLYIEQWANAGDDDLRVLKKNILDAAMDAKARNLYGAGVRGAELNVEQIGNAASHVSQQLGGSETGTDGAVGRTIPRAPKGDGAGKKPAGADGTMPNGGKGDEVNVSSGGDKNANDTSPETRIRRSGATGGLGNSAGSDTSKQGANTPQDKGSTDKGKKKKFRKSDGPWSDDDIRRVERLLVKRAPAPMMKMLTEVYNEALAKGDADKAADCSAELVLTAALDGVDLISWAEERYDPEKLTKSDVGAAIGAWLGADKNSIELKKWTAEALAAAEIIPLELARQVMAWQPARGA